MSATALAALLKPIIGPLMAFAGLLLARWAAVVIWRLLPDNALRQTLFDRRFFERHPFVPLIACVLTFAAIAAYIEHLL